MLGSAGSYLDGGANAPLQRLALPLMELDFIRRDTWALQRHFVVKRDFLLKELDKLGIIVQWSKFFLYLHILFIPSESMRRLGLKISISSKWSVGSCIFFGPPFALLLYYLFVVTSEPTATFYIWADISRLPPPLNDSLVFLEECAKHKIICVVSSFLPHGCNFF